MSSFTFIVSALDPVSFPPGLARPDWSMLLLAMKTIGRTIDKAPMSIP